MRRSIELELLRGDHLPDRPESWDLALVPAPFADSEGEAIVLAWSKTRGRTGNRERPVLLHHRGDAWQALEAPRVVFGDSLTWQGGRGAWDHLRERGFASTSDFGRAHYGRNPYDHLEAIAALVHDAYDLAIVRETDLRDALASGLVDRGRFGFEPAGALRPTFVLLASPQLSADARERVRDAVLHLDDLRFERPRPAVDAVLHGLEELGLGGFVPNELLPRLRTR
jgi:hypothetical protein